MVQGLQPCESTKSLKQTIMYTQKSINENLFSPEFCVVAKYLNFKRVAGFEKFLRQMNPNNRIAFGVKFIRVHRLLKEIESLKRSEQ